MVKSRFGVPPFLDKFYQFDETLKEVGYTGLKEGLNGYFPTPKTIYL